MPRPIPSCSLLRHALVMLLLVGCESRLPNCPGLDGGPVATFPPRDFACSAGERTPCELSVPVDSDEARTVRACPDLDGVTLTYVIDVIAVPEPSGGVAVGFDLDGFDSGNGNEAADATCEEFTPDYVGREPALVGVDNAMWGLVGTFEYSLDPAECPDRVRDGCLDARLLQDIRSGELLLVLEVTDVDSFDNDPYVVATLYSVRTEDGAPLRLDGPDDPDTRAVPDQRFNVLEQRTRSARGSILHGRLRALWPTLTLPQSGLGYPDDYTRVELRADVRPDALANGMLGGLVSVETFAAETAARHPDDADLLWSLFTQVADVTPEAGNPQQCSNLSAGYVVEGVPALLTR